MVNNCTPEKHVCGKPKVIKFKNLRQNDPYIIGKHVPVKAIVYPCQTASMNEAGLRGKEAAEEFKNLFGL